ncbi:MAG: hypothetical protein ACRDS9_17915 [Pseudonocardiaceae bacterium]
MIGHDLSDSAGGDPDRTQTHRDGHRHDEQDAQATEPEQGVSPPPALVEVIDFR